jgi:flagellin-like hook-associated protein FlgL
VIDLINNDPNNQVAANKVTAQLATNGNGIVLMTTDPSTVSPFAVIDQNGSQAAQDLGLVPAGSSQSNPATASGGTQTIAGTDVNPQETNSAFNALVRLKTALENNDTNGINRAIGLIDGSTSQLNLARADLGARESTLNSISNSLADEQNNLKSTLSNTADVDMASAITNLTALQTSFSATLQMTAQLSRMTLLNYL